MNDTPTGQLGTGRTTITASTPRDGRPALPPRTPALMDYRASSQPLSFGSGFDVGLGVFGLGGAGMFSASDCSAVMSFTH